MPVKKLQRFAEVKKMGHVFEHTDFQQNEREKPKGRWHSEIFGNSNPIILELGCGKGTITTSLAGLHPEQNYIGIDIKGARLWKGAKRAERKELGNVRFLRMYVEHLTEYFAPEEADVIWITFPDPWPRTGDSNKRLTSPRFLKMYRQILQPQGILRFKTDDDDLFEYTLKSVSTFGGKILNLYDDLHEASDVENELKIQTSFEEKHLDKGKTIKYCRFVLNEKTKNYNFVFRLEALY